ncbi:hypothetical protein JRO89_XS13G0000600 [Xanthoceras sorbifolium]|uniref:LAGLIDADG homing endonuclease n=1 Tax=Xanthoceras sorbifolium TaxID=99658 RepID=A0ABQ8H5M5_9ROSI|nr:hypothetical protein JRO89_XS13G0000600 [Xanthoceras sorbifolium]
MRKFKFMEEAGIYNLVKNQNCLIIWHYDSKGSYKVRSGYKLAMIEKSQTASLVHHLITSGGSPFGILTVENIVHMPYFGVNQFEFLYVLLWCIWNARNAIIHQKPLQIHCDILEKADVFLPEFQNTQLALAVNKPSKKTGYVPPPPGDLKLNTDETAKLR